MSATERSAWRSLDMPTDAERDDAREWLATQPDRSVLSFHLDRFNDDADRDTYAADDYCERHAKAMARKVRKTSPDVLVCDGSDGDHDGERWCSYEGCGRQLDVRLTDYGVDSAIGITESDPLDVSTTTSGLQRAAWAMGPDDTRWRLWIHHIDYLRADEAQRTRRR